MFEDKFDQSWDHEWSDYWKPLVSTDGQIDAQKVKNEMHDLVFIYQQVSKVYDALTGGYLSKPMYYADTIISEHERICNEEYDQGYKDGQELIDVLEQSCDCGECVQQVCDVCQKPLSCEDIE